MNSIIQTPLHLKKNLCHSLPLPPSEQKNVLFCKSVLSTCVLIPSPPISSRELCWMNFFLLHSLNWFLFPGSCFSFSNTLRSLLFWKRPLYDPHVLELLSHFPPPFTAKYSVPPYLCDSLSRYSSAIWLSLPPPTPTWLCLWSPISKFEGLFLISVPFSHFAMVSIAGCHLLWNPLLSCTLLWVQVCCAASASLCLLCSVNALTGSMFVSLLLGCGHGGGSPCSLLLSLLLPLISCRSRAYHHSFKSGTCLILCTHLFSLMPASCLLSFSVLATLAFFWVLKGAGAFLTQDFCYWCCLICIHLRLFFKPSLLL